MSAKLSGGESRRTPGGFVIFAASYAAANAGATIAFVPLLMLILPLKVQQISPDNKLQLLSLVLLFGAITASLTGIAAGWVSDRIFARSGQRTGQIAAALGAVLASLSLFAQANTPATLIAAIVLFQVTLNMLYSPIGALLADKVPHEAKGRMAAFLGLGMPMGTLMIAALTLPFFTTEAERLIAVGIVIIMLVCPILVTARQQPNLAAEQSPADIPAASPASSTASSPDLAKAAKRDLIWAWTGRFCVQISGAVIFGYILYFLQDVLARSETSSALPADAALGQMSLAATPAAILAGLSAGYVSDKLRARKTILLGAAGLVAASLWAMVIWPSSWTIFAAYVVFSAALTTYLTMDNAIVTQLLARSEARARTLGVMNLTNTLPAILTPAIALALNSVSLTRSELIPLMQFAGTLAVIGLLAAQRIRTID